MGNGRQAAAPSVGATIGKGYTIRRVIGAGAYGTVYEAAGPGGSRVGLKVLLRTDGQSWSTPLRRFVREAQITGRLDSRHIVGLLDAGVDPSLELPYIVMPLLRGFSLEPLVRLGGPLQPTVAARIMRQACRGVAFAHAARVIHRDLKPANLFLDHDSAGGVLVRVLDFGLAKWETPDAEITKTGMCIGTPYFMAPEQIRHSKQADHRADLWGLGATLYYALCRKWPYAEARNIGELVVAMHKRDPAPLQEAAPWLDPALASLVHGCLVRQREARCPSVGELSDALGAFTGGSDELRASMLWPVPTAVRGEQQPRTELPSRWAPAPPTTPPALPVSGAVGALATGLEEQVDTWCRPEWRLRLEPSQSSGSPVSLEQVARGLADGTIPWDAQLAREGTATWRFATLVVFA